MIYLQNAKSFRNRGKTVKKSGEEFRIIFDKILWIAVDPEVHSIEIKLEVRSKNMKSPILNIQF